MSYPSIAFHLAHQGVNINRASDAQLATAFLAAFDEDLPLGMARVRELVSKVAETKDRAMLTLDPHSEEGKQFARLLGPDIPRRILQDHFGIAFGFYNCCKGVGAGDEQSLRLSLREQMEAQHPNFVDC